MTQETQQILRTAYDNMPNQFTSREFTQMARKIGLADDQFFRQGNGAKFLHTIATQSKSCRAWIKGKAENTYDAQNYYPERRIFDAIALLKAHGYKIMQKETKYVEV